MLDLVKSLLNVLKRKMAIVVMAGGDLAKRRYWWEISLELMRPSERMI